MAGIALAPACGSPANRASDASGDASQHSSSGATTAPESSTALPLRRDLTLSDRAKWQAILKWPDECEAAFQASHAGTDPGLVFHEVAAQLAIVEVLCAAGSYQPSSTLVRFDERGSTPAAAVLRFPVYGADDAATLTQTETAEIWGEIAIDAAKSVMTVLNLARQTGDCGVWTRYDISGAAPALAEARARLPCPARPRPPLRLDAGHPPVGWRRVRTTG